MNLLDFLRARITEQEIRCRTLLDTADLSPAARRALTVALNDCDAKRRIIEVQAGWFSDDEEEVLSWELMALAYTYSDHPEWRAEWAPVS